MDEQNKNSNHGAECSCPQCKDGKCGCWGWCRCGCGKTGGSTCGTGMHCGRHWWILRLVVVIAAIFIAFGLGIKVGEFKASLYGRHGMMRGYGYQMMGGYAPGMMRGYWQNGTSTK